MTSQPNLLVRLYRLTHHKYVKLTARLDRNIRSGRFHSLARSKRSSIIHKIEKLRRKLQQLSLQLKLGAAAGAVAFFLNAGEVKAQLGPFIQQDRSGNPVRPPLADLFQIPAAADVDGDGDIDVLVGLSDGRLRYYRNDGTAQNPEFNEAFGEENPFESLTTPANNVSPSLADVDGDDDPDLVLVGEDGVFYYFSNNEGVFTEGTGPWDDETGLGNPFDDFSGFFNEVKITSADMDGDADIDIVVGFKYDYSADGDQMVMLENDGSGNFTRSDILDLVPISDMHFPAFADADNDGDMDMFLGEDYIGGTSVNFYLQDDGSFTQQFGAWDGVEGNPFEDFSFDSYGAPLFVDLDNDGDLDAIVGRNYKYSSFSSEYENSLAYLENTGDFVFEQKSELENPFDGIVSKAPEDNQGDADPAFLDVDNDGDLDMLLGSKYNQQILYYEFDQTKGVFIKAPEPDPFSSFTFGNALTIRTHDFNQDGYLDLFTWDSYNYLSYFQNNQDGTFTEDTENAVASLGLTNTISIALLDVDGDGDEDLFAGLGYNPGFRFYRNEEGVYTPETTTAPFPFNDNTILGSVPARISAADINSDGNLDLLTGRSNTGEVRVFLNTNANSFGEMTDDDYPFVDISTGIDTSPILADFDGDGDKDLFVGDEQGEISYLENQNPSPVVDVQTVTEPDPDEPVLVFPNLDLTDADDDMIVKAIISINNFSPTNEIITIPSGLPAGIISTYNPSAGVLNLMGIALLDDYELALRQISYENEEGAFSGGRSINKTIRIEVFDEDGTTPIAAVANLSHANELPVVSAVNSRTYGGTPLLLDNTLTITDNDDNELTSASVTITNYINGEDELTIPSTLPGGITGTFVVSTGVLQLTGAASPTNYRNALRMVQYVNNATGAPTPTTRNIEIRVNDGESNSLAEVIAIAFANNPPSLASGVAMVDYSGAAVVVNNDITATDPENINLASATVTISSGYVSTEDVLAVTNAGGLTPNFDAATGTLTLTGLASLAAYETALESVTYENTNGFGGNTSPRTISFVVNDGAAASNTVDVTVNYSNQSPSLTSTISTIDYTSGVEVINDAIDITDADSPDMASASVSITGNFQSGEDVLSFTAEPGITGSYDATSGVLSLTGAATIAAYETTLQSVAYENTGGFSTNRAQRTISFVVNDGTTDSNIITTSINFVNLAPSITNSGAPAPYVSGEIVIAEQIVLADSDNPNLQNSTVTISQGFAAGEDELIFVNTGSITGSFNITSGVLTLSGTAIIADYQAALRTVQYRNNNTGDRSKADRVFTFSVNDGIDESNTIDVTLSIPNQTPSVSVTGNPPLYGSGEITIAGGLTLSDGDNATFQSASVSISTGLVASEDELLYSAQNGINGSYSSATGILSLTGSATVSDYQLALQSVQYRNNANEPSPTPRTISFSVNDGMDQSLVASVALSINRPPDVDPGSGNGLAGKDVTINLSALISDPDNNLDLSSAVIVSGPTSGADADIVNGQLVVNYASAPDFTGEDVITVRVCDALGRCTEQQIVINVTAEVVVYDAISPNGDAKNDYFRIKFIRPNSHVTIYNRWGDRVYEQFDYDNDDPGKRFEGVNDNGTSLPSGTYFYKIELPENNGGPVLLTGYLTLKY